jgi:biotin carboxyl carrier protein
VVKYHVVVEGRIFEAEVGPDGRVWVNQRPLNVDLEGIDGLPEYSLLVDHRSYEARVEAGEDGECRVTVAGRAYRARLRGESWRQTGSPAARPEDGAGRLPVSMEVCAPLPGLLVEVCVAEGQRVGKGEVVAVLESMKMHMELRAPREGVVHSLWGGTGREVAQGEVLAVVGDPRTCQTSAPAEQI